MSWCGGRVVRMVVMVVFINDDDERRPKSSFVVWLPPRCGRCGNWLGLVHGVGVWDGWWGLWVSWHCCVVVDVSGWHGCWGLWVPIVGVVEWAGWTILGPRLHSEEMGEGGVTYLDINDDERQQTLSFVVWLPRRCGRRGTCWALVHSVTWHGRLVLEQ